MKFPVRVLLASAAMGITTAGSAFALTVGNTDDATALAQATLSGTSGISLVSNSASLIGGTTQQGTYSGFNQTSPIGPTLSIDDGIVLTTGLGTFSTTRNELPQAQATTGTGSFQPLVDLAFDNGLSTTQNDSNVLEFQFTLDDTSQNAVTAQFLFATDEFPTEPVTDILGVFVNGVNYAFFPNGDLVSNQAGDPNDFFNENPVWTDASNGYGLEWNGLTDVFEITMLANGGGAVNTIQIAIADTVYTLYASSIFFTNLQGTTTGGGGGIGPNPEVIPLPATGLLLLGGMGGLIAMRRRRKA